MEQGSDRREKILGAWQSDLPRSVVCAAEERQSALATDALAAVREHDVLGLSENCSSLGQGENFCEGELLLEPLPPDLLPAVQHPVLAYVEAEYIEVGPVNDTGVWRLPPPFAAGTTNSELARALVGGNRAETQLARALSTAAPETEKHVVFSVAGVNYAVPMRQVLELSELEHFTPVPNLPAWVLGVTNLRGDIVSVVDTRVLIGLESQVPPARNLLVAETLDGALTTCLLVERVQGMASVLLTEIQKQDRLLRDGLTPYTRGVYTHEGEPLSVLNLESLLHSLEITH